ncbi:MAG: methionyl-tRNA formyltransferase [Spirochaetes bacterium RBG_13_51_14]|nr:MAG: methionyl-tRNA formyltransferase [Spirochaetes bacterium RBG_13_51_14]
MRIGFFGTPDLAARVLADLHGRHDIRFAVTGLDKQVGRRRGLQFCPAKNAALRLGIPVLQPSTLKDASFQDEIRKHDAEIFVVVAFGSLIPRQVFDLPPLKTINLHPSLLPKYRGAAPIQWSLLNGEKVTGITVQLINEKLDAGDIIVQETVPIGPDTTAADLYSIVSSRDAELLDRAMRLLASGSAKPVRQDDSQATYCGKINRDTARIDWTRSAAEIHNLVRGLNPKPGAFSAFRGELIKIWKTVLMTEDVSTKAWPGSIVVYQKKRLLAAAGDGLVEIVSIQPANKKIMGGQSFINGYRLAPNDRFE